MPCVFVDLLPECLFQQRLKFVESSDQQIALSCRWIDQTA